MMPSLNPALRSFWQDDNGKFIKARNRILHGGRSSSKSWEYAGRIAQISQEYKTRVLCVRRFQNKIKDSVYTLIRNQIDYFRLNGFNVLATSIEHANGSEFAFFGIDRNIDDIKGFEGADVLWIEEAHLLTKDQWDILEPTIRKEGSEVWISFNGRLVTDFVWQHFIINTPPDTIVRQINYTENEFLSSTILKIINNLKESDYETYKHVYLGVPLSDDEAVIIKKTWIDASIDAHKLIKGLDGRKSLGYDVADSGDDLNATILIDGSICLYSDQWKAKEDELNKSTKRAMITAKQNKASIIYDSIGVGAHTGSTLNTLDFRQHSKFNAGGKVVKPKMKYKSIPNAEFFSNLKSQAWWLVADRFRNTYNAVTKGENFKSDDLISISSDCSNLQQLVVELSTPRKDFDKQGRVKVESKIDLKARNVKSPNLADAFIMAANKGLVSSSTIQAVTVQGF